MIYDAQSNITGNDGVNAITWTVYGKINSIYKTTGTISYTYDASGQRVSKTANGVTTWYIRDAQGNPLALYDNSHSANNWREQDLYGSSRLGMCQPDVNLTVANATAVWDTIGGKSYELNNHLGNVLATITDKRLQVSTDGSTINNYTADVATAQDYYPFGMLMPGRQYSFSNVYRYGFNGKENDNEVKGVGEQQNYGMRIYDTRAGRFLSVDPLFIKYPELTPYQFASNTPIQAMDVDGLERYHYTILFNKNDKAYISYLRTEDIVDHTLKFTPHFPFVSLVTEINDRKEFVIQGVTTRNWDNFGNTIFYNDDDEKTFSTLNEAKAYVKKNNGLGYVFSFSHQLGQSARYLHEQEAGSGDLFTEPEIGSEPTLREGTSAKPAEVITIELKVKKGWTPEQQTAARNKIAIASSQNPTVVEAAPMRSSNLRSQFIKSGGHVTSFQDVDHILDLQLGGTNEMFNLQGLDMSVNRSLGSQIQKQIQNLAPGTKVNIVIKGP